MPFHSILYVIPLSNNLKKRLYQLTKRIGHLSSAAFFASSVSAIKAEDIKSTPFLQCPHGTGDHCLVEPMAETFFARDSNFATAPASRTFDYDPSLLPEVAEAIFVLRIKHANIGKPLVINLSGNYLLRFDKNKIDILDTYTENTSVYQYQTTNPNITIGLGVSKGLPRNYKSITIKEDAHGKLYDYAALRSDNISTDESMLTETLSHPFYQITGEGTVENEVKVTKAMAFYRKILSHERHARCVKSSQGIFSQLQDILWGSDSGVCGPKAGQDIFTANHQPASEMKLDQQLVEAAYQNNLKYGVGYQFRRSYDLHVKNPVNPVTNAVTIKTASLVCGKSIKDMVGDHRKRRDIDPEALIDCTSWVFRLVYAYLVLHLDFRRVTSIVVAVAEGAALAAHGYFLSTVRQHVYDDNIKILSDAIKAHGQEAKEALQIAAGVVGQAVMADPEFLVNYRGITDVQDAVAHGSPAFYEVSKKTFKPLPNEVSRVDSYGKVKVVDGEHYTTHFISPLHFDEMAKKSIDTYSRIVSEWHTQFETMLANPFKTTYGNIKAKQIAKAQLYFIYNIAEAINFYLSRIGKGKNKSGIELINTIYHNDVLLGISVGLLNNREYRTIVQLSSPQALTRNEGGYRGVLPYLESEVVRSLFSHNMIGTASIVNIVPQTAAYPAEIVLHEEL